MKLEVLFVNSGCLHVHTVCLINLTFLFIGLCHGRWTMLEEELEVAIKVVVVGNGAVGKSSMIQRYCRGVFTRDYKKTIGVDFLERQIE